MKRITRKGPVTNAEARRLDKIRNQVRADFPPMKTTHIISTDLVRPVDDIVKDIEKMGITTVQVLRPTKVIFVNVPAHLDWKAMRHINGIEAVGPNHQIRAC